jgi:hypothetical protein
MNHEVPIFPIFKLVEEGNGGFLDREYSLSLQMLQRKMKTKIMESTISVPKASHVNSKSCSTNGERSSLPLPMSTKNSTL